MNDVQVRPVKLGSDVGQSLYMWKVYGRENLRLGLGDIRWLSICLQRRS